MAAPDIKVLETLQDDQNFLVEKVLYEGKKAIRKSLKITAPERKNIAINNESRGVLSFANLQKSMPEKIFRLPRIYDYSDKFIIEEFFEGKTLVDFIGTDQALVFLKKIADGLVEIDKLTPVEDFGSESYTMTYRDITKNMNIWLEASVEDGLLTYDDVQKCYEIVKKYESILTPKYAHGDLTPIEHCFMDEDGNICLIDFELYNSIKPRYYDAAYCFTRTYSMVDQKSLAGDFISYFIEKSNDFDEKQMIAIFMQRSAGLCFDAIEHARNGINYKDKAKVLFDLCLAEDLETIKKL